VICDIWQKHGANGVDVVQHNPPQRKKEPNLPERRTPGWCGTSGLGETRKKNSRRGKRKSKRDGLAVPGSVDALPGQRTKSSGWEKCKNKGGIKKKNFGRIGGGTVEKTEGRTSFKMYRLYGNNDAPIVWGVSGGERASGEKRT